MLSHDVRKLAEKIVEIDGYEYQRYGEIALKITNGCLKKDQINETEFNKIREHMQGIRRQNRSLAFAHTTVLTLLKHEDLNTLMQYELWSLHASYALNLNIANVARDAAAKAVGLLTEDEPLRLSKATTILATASRNCGDYVYAIACYLKARDLALIAEYPERANWQTFRLGKLYVNYLQQPSRGVEYLTRAKNAFQTIKTDEAVRGEAACLDELGDVYRETTVDLDRAWKLYEEALSLNQSINNPRGRARNLAHMAICYQKKNEHEKALRLMKEAIAEIRQIAGQERGVAIRLVQYAGICIEGENLGDAEDALREAGELAKQYPDYRHRSKLEITRGVYFRKMRDFNLAKSHLREAIRIGKEHGLYELEAEAYDQLADMCMSELEDYKQAQDAVIAAGQLRVKAWDRIARSNPELEEVESKMEIASMYKSLFSRLLEESANDLRRTIYVVGNAYDVAQKESHAKYEHMLRAFQIGAVMIGIRHESLNLVNDILSTISEVLKEQTIHGEIKNQLESSRAKLLHGLELLRGPVIDELLVTRKKSNQAESSKAILFPIFEWIKDENSGEGILTELPDEIPDVKIGCPGIVLRLMIGSLVQNAREAFQGGSHKVIKIKVVMPMERMDRLWIEVEDNGRGMDDSEIKVAFQLGFSTKPGHSGLGIPTVSFLAESIGGELAINSAYGKGTTARLVVPIVGDKSS